MQSLWLHCSINDMNRNGCFSKWSIQLLVIALLQVCMVSLTTAQDSLRPAITGIAFVQLQVSDTKKATVFYHALMGYDVNALQSVTGNKHHFFNIPVNYRQSIQLEDGLPPEQDERMLCLAFQTTDAEAMRVYLQAKAVTVPPAVSKEGGMLFFMVHDPDNHPLKFVQYQATGKAQTPINPFAGTVSRRILHAGLTIASAHAADAFYAGILGFSEIWRGGVNDSVTSWINMRVPEGTDYLEYMLVSGPVSRQQLGSMHHIALMVPDMQAAVDFLGSRLGTNAYPVASPRIGRNRRWQLNLFDPDGTRIELMEPFTMR